MKKIILASLLSLAICGCSTASHAQNQSSPQRSVAASSGDQNGFPNPLDCAPFSWTVTMMTSKMESQAAIVDFFKTIGSDNIQAPIFGSVNNRTGSIFFVIKVNPNFQADQIDALKANTLAVIQKLQSIKGVALECNYPPQPLGN